MLLKKKLSHARDKMPRQWIFQHDNVPKHTSILVKGFLKQESVNIMQWPAQSPDLKPIENLWEIVNRKVNSDPNKLYQVISKACSAIPMNITDNLISSMPKR